MFKNITVNTILQFFILGSSTYKNTKRLHPEIIRKLSPENVERLKEAHLTYHGYYQNNTEMVRECRLTQLLKDYPHEGHFSLRVPSLTELGDLELKMLLQQAQLINDNSPDSLAQMSEIIQRISSCLHCSPDECKWLWSGDVSVLEEYWHIKEKFLDTISTSPIPDLNMAAKEVLGSDTYFFISSIVFYPEYILLFLLLFFIFSQCPILYYMNILFWSLLLLGTISLIRAAFYPLPNLFLVEDYYLCDIFSGYVKGIFYLLLSFYVLMIYDRSEYLHRDPTNTKIGLIALLFLIVFTTAAISSFDLFFFYLAVEGMSFSTLLVFTFSNVKKVSRQAALRYFCLNAFASGWLVFSVALLYGLGGDISFSGLMESYVDYKFMPFSLTVAVTVFFIFAAFKLALFPFSAWLPEIYNQLTYPTIYLFGVILKCVLLLIFFRISVYVFPPFFDIISPIFFGLGFISFVFGAIGAFSQSNLRKFLAYTSISHIGIVVICLSTMDEMGFFASFQYLATYVIASSIIFYLLSVTTVSSVTSDKPQLLSLYSISELRFFKESSVVSSVLLTLAFLSMAGIAPLAGFWAKYYVVLTFFYYGWEMLAYFFLFISAVSLYYYLQIIRAIWFEPVTDTDTVLKNFSTITNAQMISILYLLHFSLILVFYYLLYYYASYLYIDLFESANSIFSASSSVPVKETLCTQIYDNYLLKLKILWTQLSKK